MKSIVIAGREISPQQPPYIIAELSANHNGKIERALETISMAKECGVDAVKIQTYTPDTMTIDCNNEDFQVHGGLWDGYNLYKLYEWAQTPFKWHKQIFDHARNIGLTIFSTPFDETAVDLLEDLNVPAYKIASFEATDLPLISYVASTGKPLIISTGMANLDEITELVDTARSSGCDELILLHCISSYPAPVEQSHIKTIPDLSKRFNVLAGLSDHTLGTTVSIASIALGACIIEKHFTLSREEKGPDSEFSLEPSELKQLVKDCETSWLALGEAGYDRKPSEESSMKFRRSLYIVKDINKGDFFTEKNVRRIRPGYGLSPKHYKDILGKSAAINIKRGTALQWEHIDK